MLPSTDWALFSAEWRNILVPGAAFLGLLIGSFLNVVILRLPRMLEQEWARECAEFNGQNPDLESAANAATTPFTSPPLAPYNLVTPRSQCPACSHHIRWFENIPVLSFLFLRGKCAACKHAISLRYPLVEVATGCIFAYCAARWGLSPSAGAWAAFMSALLALALIDWDTTLLPDNLTQPLLWGGLVASALQWTSVPLVDALWGAVAGYLFLWSIYWAFKLITGKEGMGFGDFKLLAALGAWLGWTALVPVVLIASITGALVGIVLKMNSRLREGGYVPFGPFLAAGGVLHLVWPPLVWPL